MVGVLKTFFKNVWTIVKKGVKYKIKNIFNHMLRQLSFRKQTGGVNMMTKVKCKVFKNVFKNIFKNAPSIVKKGAKCREQKHI
jgi:hypothetical protein